MTDNASQSIAGQKGLNKSATRNNETADDQSSYNTINIMGNKQKKGRTMYTGEASLRELQRPGLKPIWQDSAA